MPEEILLLAQWLVQLGYRGLFNGTDQERSLDEIWKSAPQQDFERLAGDAAMPSLARFLSSQILIRKDMTFPARADLRSLTDIYIKALVDNYTGMMSDWGFQQDNDDLGPVGSIFLILGDHAVPALMNLLKNDTIVDYKRRSPDFSGFDWTKLQRTRIKDFAALYLSKIKNVPVHFKTRFDERDKEIAELERKLSPG